MDRRGSQLLYVNEDHALPLVTYEFRVGFNVSRGTTLELLDRIFVHDRPPVLARLRPVEPVPLLAVGTIQQPGAAPLLVVGLI